MNTCPDCKKLFSQKSSLNRHINTENNKCKRNKDGIIPKCFTCESCNRILSTKQRLDSHKKICKVSVTKNFSEIVLSLHEKINSLDNEVKSLKGKNETKTTDKNSETKNDSLETTPTPEIKTSKLVKNFTSKTNHYFKFNNTDPCFYIIESGVPCNDCGSTNIQYKFGITGTGTVCAEKKNMIDDRLRSHRTLWPMLKVKFLLFMKEVTVIEKNFKIMYDKEINPNRHEIISGVPLEDITERIKKLLNLLCVKEYNIIPDEILAKYNDYVSCTLKTQ